MRNDILLWVAAIAFLALIVVEPSFSWQLRTLIFSENPAQKNITELVIENEALKAKLAELEGGVRAAGAVGPSLRADVFSHYPFNVKNQILINAGAAQNVKVGDAALLTASSSDSVLLGKVIKVFRETALIETVFDEGWQSAVRIGQAGHEALFAGGSEPKLSFIAKDVAIVPGDAVYSVDPAFPYGVAIAEVKSVALSNDQIFQEAELRFPYDLSQIRAVAIKSHETSE